MGNVSEQPGKFGPCLHFSSSSGGDVAHTAPCNGSPAGQQRPWLACVLVVAVMMNALAELTAVFVGQAASSLCRIGSQRRCELPEALPLPLGPGESVATGTPPCVPMRPLSAQVPQAPRHCDLECRERKALKKHKEEERRVCGPQV